MTFSSFFSSSVNRLSLIFIGIGILLGIDSCLQLHFIYKLWPLLITLFGVGFVGLFLKRNKREGFYAGLGTYLICFSIFALYLNFAGWINTARRWPLFIAFLGLSFIASGWSSSKAHRKLRMLLGMVLLSLAAVLHFVFFVDPSLWWMSFLLAGGSILMAELSG